MKDTRTELKKADLHIHTPASVCYSNSATTGSDIVNAALKAEIDVIAVTDHNSIAGIDDIRATAEGRLWVFPGVEITTKNGHFLALFEPESKIAELEAFLDYAGIEKKGWGDAHTVAVDETTVTLKKIHEYGGIAVAAHIDRWPSGFMETKTTRRNKQTIHECEHLGALEITIAANRQQWQDGKVRGFSLPRACIQGSDAHKPEEIGRRPIYITLSSPGLQGLRQAFDNFRNCIFFPDDLDLNITK